LTYTSTFLDLPIFSQTGNAFEVYTDEEQYKRTTAEIVATAYFETYSLPV